MERVHIEELSLCIHFGPPIITRDRRFRASRVRRMLIARRLERPPQITADLEVELSTCTTALA